MPRYGIGGALRENIHDSPCGQEWARYRNQRAVLARGFGTNGARIRGSAESIVMFFSKKLRQAT